MPFIFLLIFRAYHGHSSLLIDVSPYKYNAPGGEGKKDFVHAVPTPDPYRGKHQGESTPELGEQYALDVKEALDSATKDGRKVRRPGSSLVMGRVPTHPFPKATILAKLYGTLSLLCRIPAIFACLLPPFSPPLPPPSSPPSSPPPPCNVGPLFSKPYLTNNIAWGEGGGR